MPINNVFYYVMNLLSYINRNSLILMVTGVKVYMSGRPRCCEKKVNTYVKVCGMSASPEHSGHTRGTEKHDNAV